MILTKIYVVSCSWRLKKIAEIKNIATSGFRCIMNTNSDGGQTVFHIHMHVLGGRKLNWPPG